MSGYLVAAVAAVAGAIDITSKSETSKAVGLENLLNIKKLPQSF